MSRCQNGLGGAPLPESIPRRAAVGGDQSGQEDDLDEERQDEDQNNLARQGHDGFPNLARFDHVPEASPANAAENATASGLDVRSIPAGGAPGINGVAVQVATRVIADPPKHAATTHGTSFLARARSRRRYVRRERGSSVGRLPGRDRSRGAWS